MKMTEFSRAKLNRFHKKSIKDMSTREMVEYNMLLDLRNRELKAQAPTQGNRS